MKLILGGFHDLLQKQGSHLHVDASTLILRLKSSSYAVFTDDELVTLGVSINAGFEGLDGNVAAKVGRFLPLQLNS